jgi:hypothetical protein
MASNTTKKTILLTMIAATHYRETQQGFPEAGLCLASLEISHF